MATTGVPVTESNVGDVSINLGKALLLLAALLPSSEGSHSRR
jgi:hypothetical protein